MIRFALRLLGLILLAGAFAALIIDGTRTIAGGSLALTPFGTTLIWAMPLKFESLREQLQHLSPYLWDPVAVKLLALPTWAVAGTLGLLALALPRKKRSRIGYSSRD
jgi:hypothetical protein